MVMPFTSYFDQMYFTINDLDLYYEVRGEGKPFLMIHGYGLDHHVMSGCMEPILKNRPGYKRIYFDLPGMGKTEPRNWISNSDVMLKVILRFMGEVIPDGNFLVAGESYGGYLARALIYHMADRIDGTALICPLIVPQREDRKTPPHIVLVRDQSLIDRMTREEAEWFDYITTIQDRKTYERFMTDLWPGFQSDRSSFTSWFQRRGYALMYDVDDLPAPFGKPVLLFAGRQDISVGYLDHLKIIENFPRGTFAILDRASHSLQIEQEEIFNLLINEWLDRVEEHRVLAT